MMISVHYICCIYKTFGLTTNAVNDQKSKGVGATAADWFESSL